MSNEINRRHMLLGLAAASTAAATVTAEASIAKPIENPKLIKLADKLPAIAAAYRDARKKQTKIEKYWRSQAWAPDELTVPGTAWPYDDGGRNQPGEPERTVIGGYLWRYSDDFPRRIVVTSWEVNSQMREARRDLRKARKEGRLADCLALEDELGRLKKLERVAADYERKFRETSKKAHEEYDPAWPVTMERLEDLEKHIAKIMKTPDWSMEGLLIKAQALAEWDRVDQNGGRKFSKLAFRHGEDWYGQIAASILRHAKGGAA